ncbi:MAG: hypothetical protein QNJ47_07825 [Nostocaceae cyanobacterium]|nr:hypothetical protein [Nostocaceae cyanobacterium]
MSQQTKTPTKINNKKKKFNYTKWGFIFGPPIAFLTLLATITVPEVRNLFGLTSESRTVEEKVLDIFTKTETGEASPHVKLQIEYEGNPQIKYTDSAGYARFKIPSKAHHINIILTKQGFPSQNFNIDLEKQERKRIEVRFQKSGVPEIRELPPGNSSASTPNLSPANTSISTPNSSSSNSSISDNKSTPLWQTECDSATSGRSLKSILSISKNNDKTVIYKTKVLRRVASMVGSFYSSSSDISPKKPIQFSCNLSPGYQILNLEFGIHKKYKQARPENQLFFQVFLDDKALPKKEVVLGEKNKLIVKVQGVKNVSLRVECISESRCTPLNFSKMSLQ